MKKGIMLFADGFEEVEALATIDVLRRAGIEIDMVSMMKQKNVISKERINVKCDYIYPEVSLNDYDFLVIPGGSAVMTYLYNDHRVFECIQEFNSSSRLVACICAAPSLLGKAGLLDNKEFNCFPGFEKFIPNGIHSNDPVVRTGNIITGRSMYYAIDFGLEIIDYVTKDSTLVENVKNQIQYKR